MYVIENQKAKIKAHLYPNIAANQTTKVLYVAKLEKSLHV